MSYERMKARGSYTEATTQTSEQRLAEQIAWAERTLPAEHPWFVVVAAQRVKETGRPVTVERVLAHLRLTGRASEQHEDTAA